ALDKWLDDPAKHGRLRPAMYCCGPDPLLKAVDERARARGLTAWLSLDRRMGCAVGACLGCVVKTKDGAQVRVCKDGPVFRGGAVDW
ncbi:MAG: dihydroorotate dehydrogenase electron transfer subunit, partial [Kiritimatiellaeota bacterium]|nr:dihydroorotate dehydrogenase electron transfer subunit [Kiritimatiellota bacterium]